MQKGSENAKKTRRLDKDEIKKQLIESMFNNDLIETDELNKKADKVEKPDDAAAIRGDHSDQEERHYIHRVSTGKNVQKVQGQGKVHQTSQ